MISGVIFWKVCADTWFTTIDRHMMCLWKICILYTPIAVQILALMHTTCMRNAKRRVPASGYWLTALLSSSVSFGLILYGASVMCWHDCCLLTCNHYHFFTKCIKYWINFCNGVNQCMAWQCRLKTNTLLLIIQFTFSSSSTCDTDCQCLRFSFNVMSTL